MTYKKEPYHDSFSDSICRLCLSKDNLSDISFGESNNGTSLPTKIMTCIALAISPNDLLSKLICPKCTELLNMFFEFKETCLSAHVEQCNLLTKGCSSTFTEHNYFESSTCAENQEDSTFEDNIDETDLDDEETVAHPTKLKLTKGKEDCVLVVEADEEQGIINPEDLLKYDPDVVLMKETLEADGYYECDDCNAVFMSIKDLVGHVENDKCSNRDSKKDFSVTRKKNINVPKTRRSIPRTSERKAEHPEKPDKLVKAFRRERNRVKRTKEDLICEMCGKEYKTAKGIVAHRRSHTGEKFPCNICKSAFSDPYDLKYHLRVHSDNPQYSCKYCKKAFRNPAGLLVHERTHTNERPFVCDFCGKSFPGIQNLRLHLRIHTGEKPYPCKYCARRFRTIPAAVSHQKRHLNGKRLFQCDFCWRMYETKEDLVKHTSQHKSMAVWRCKQCKLCFKKRSTLKVHIRELHASSSKTKSSRKSAEVPELVSMNEVIVEEEMVKCVYCDALMSLQEMHQHVAMEHANEDFIDDDDQYEMGELKNLGNGSVNES